MADGLYAVTKQEHDVSRIVGAKYHTTEEMETAISPAKENAGIVMPKKIGEAPRVRRQTTRAAALEILSNGCDNL